MRITKLHLLGIFFLCALAFSGHYYFNQKKKEVKLREERARLEQEQKNIEEREFEKMKLATEFSSSTASGMVNAGGRSPVNYTIQKGDTLWKIAKMTEHFGAGHRWYDIWKANEEKILDFDHLESGLTLTIPLDIPENFPWPPTADDRREKILKRLNPQARRIATN